MIYQKFIVDCQSFVTDTLSEIKNLSLKIVFHEIDHVCYRTDTIDHYREMKSFLNNHAIFLTEEIIGGRPISVFKLTKPIIVDQYMIDLIELPAPKKESSYHRGFEHIEIVTDQDFTQIIDLNPHVQFSDKSKHIGLNPELKLKLSKASVKFHYQSLEHIINIEKNAMIMNFLRASDLFNQFQKYRPIISGTLPLDIGTSSSDLDILFSSFHLEEAKKEFTNFFSSYDGFALKEGLHQGINSFVINFTYQQLPIELFVQSLSTYRQQAHQHFLIEGRLLKIFPQIKAKIQKLKEEGFQTEPAFGDVFHLDSPYEDLLELGKKSDLDLWQCFSNSVK